jgi:hypothetical protein
VTKTQATQMARRQLQGGYTRIDSETGSVECPACKKHVVVFQGVMGRMPKMSEMVAQIAQGVMDCEYDRANPPSMY